jgi:hypothetical protein
VTFQVDGLEVRGAGNRLHLLVVTPPVLQTENLLLGRVEVHSQHLLLLGIALFAGRTHQQFVILVFDQMLQ